MRNTLSKTIRLGAVVATIMALNIGGAYAVDEDIDRVHEPAIVIESDGEFHMIDEGHAAPTAHHEEVDGLPQLDFTTYSSQIFWMFVAFITLYIFFSKRTLPEISSTVENRREKIGGDLEGAQNLKEQAEKVQGEYEDALRKAREKSSAFFKDAESSIKADSNARIDAFKARAVKLTQETEANLNKAKENALLETQSVAAEIASIAAEKIVGIPTDIKQAETLVKNISRKAA